MSDRTRIASPRMLRWLVATAGLTVPPKLAFAHIIQGPMAGFGGGFVHPLTGTTSAAAALSGAALGILIAFRDPSMADARYLSGAAAAGLCLIAAPPLLLRHVEQSWLTIGGRIFASWLIAMGLLLGASSYVVKQRAERAAATERAMPPDRPVLPHRRVVNVPY